MKTKICISFILTNILLLSGCSINSADDDSNDNVTPVLSKSNAEKYSDEKFVLDYDYSHANSQSSVVVTGDGDFSFSINAKYDLDKNIVLTDTFSHSCYVHTLKKMPQLSFKTDDSLRGIMTFKISSKTELEESVNYIKDFVKNINDIAKEDKDKLVYSFIIQELISPDIVDEVILINSSDIESLGLDEIAERTENNYYNRARVLYFNGNESHDTMLVEKVLSQVEQYESNDINYSITIRPKNVVESSEADIVYSNDQNPTQDSSTLLGMIKNKYSEYID